MKTRIEIVTMKRSKRYANGRFKPAYYRIYQDGTLKGDRSTRKAAQNLKNMISSV